jgi:hypothetical protein
MVRSVNVNLIEIPPGTVPFLANDKYIKPAITKLLESYECVLFAESPDDVLTPGPVHDCDLGKYLIDFISGPDRYRFLTGINIVQNKGELPYDPMKGTLLSQRSTMVRCQRYDNPFLWRDTPLWGRGWHDLGGGRIVGGGDTQGDDKRLYNLHIHYADFELTNRRHRQRLASYTDQQRTMYESFVDNGLWDHMCKMITNPQEVLRCGYTSKMEPWMAKII